MKWLFLILPAITLNTAPIWCLPMTSSALLWTQPLTAPATENCVSLPTLGYISRLIWARLFSIASAPASTTAPLQVFTSPLPAAPGCSMPRREDFVPEVIVTPAKRPPVIVTPAKRPQVRLLCCWGSWCPYQEAAGHNFASPPCSCIQHIFTSLPCGAASCSCEPKLPSGTTLPTQDWMPLWHSFGSSLWRKSLLLRACSCHLVPLY